MALNPNAQKLVDALRSGEYKQTNGALRRGNAFCCLGVACDLYAQKNNLGWRVVLAGENTSFLGSLSYLPDAVKDWLSFSYEDGGYYDAFNVRVSLAQLNDRGKSFGEIADVIEAAPEGLFYDGD